MSKSDRIDNCRSKAAVGAGLTISENFRLPEWKAAFTFFVNQTLPNTLVGGRVVGPSSNPDDLAHLQCALGPVPRPAAPRSASSSSNTRPCLRRNLTCAAWRAAGRRGRPPGRERGRGRPSVRSLSGTHASDDVAAGEEPGEPLGVAPVVLAPAVGGRPVHLGDGAYGAVDAERPQGAAEVEAGRAALVHRLGRLEPQCPLATDAGRIRTLCAWTPPVMGSKAHAEMFSRGRRDRWL